MEELGYDYFRLRSDLKVNGAVLTSYQKLEKMKITSHKPFLNKETSFNEFVNISPTRSLSFCLIISLYLHIFQTVPDRDQEHV